MPAVKRSLVSKPLGTTSAAAKQLVNRILGRTNEAVQQTDVFAKILESGKASQAATVYSHLGRALVFLNRGEDKLAKVDVALAEKAANSQVAQKLIASVDFQVKARLLDEEVRKLTISGATTEGDVATHVAQVQKALDRVETIVGDDFGVCMAAGEFYLRYGNDAKKAADYFEKAVRLSHNTSSVPQSSAVTPEAIAAAAVDEQAAPVPAVRNATVSAAEIAVDDASLKALEAKLGAGLGPQELSQLGAVIATETRGGIVYDAVNTSSEEFKQWSSKGATDVAQRVAHVVHPLLPTPVATVSKPTSVFYRDGQKVSELIKKCPSDVNVLDFVRQESGPAPSMQIRDSDASFFDALKAIEADEATTAPLETTAASRYYTNLANQLLTQVEDRAKVGLAEAYTALDKTDAAEKLLREVQQRDTYVDMWRLLLAKGQLAKKVGKIDEADKAFKELHALKVQRGANDLPLMDANRYKSAF